jgi:hypothetical protein
MSTTPHEPVPAEPQSDSPPKGRFQLGNKGGPGNPFARQCAEVRKLLMNTVPGEALAKIILALVEKAQAGDVAAAKIVLQYTAGKPAEAVDPDRIELEDHRLRIESLVPMSGWGQPFGVLPVCTANKMWEQSAQETEEETLLPMLLGALETEAAAPEDRAKVQRKTSRRAMRILSEGIRPSPNGPIGRKLEKLRRSLHEEPKEPAKRTKSARAG